MDPDIDVYVQLRTDLLVLGESIVIDRPGTADGDAGPTVGDHPGGVVLPFPLSRWLRRGIERSLDLRDTIESADDIDELASYMETVPGTDIPWCLYYIVLGAAGTFLAALASTGTLAFGGSMLAALFSGLVLGSGLLHAYSERECLIRCD